MKIMRLIKKHLVMKKDVRNLNEEERFQLIYQLNMDKSVFKYVKTRLKNLLIEIGGEHKGNVLELMKEGLLAGWCWQTTESSIVFFNEDDYVERGNLTVDPSQKVWHSWICFTFNKSTWVFDPCSQVLIEKDIYYHIFEINEPAGVVKAEAVRKELIDTINNCPKKQSDIFSFLKPYMSERQKNEIHIYGEDDVKSPMYRNSTGYTATIENGALSNLIAHYYFELY